MVADSVAARDRAVAGQGMTRQAIADKTGVGIVSVYCALKADAKKAVWVQPLGTREGEAHVKRRDELLMQFGHNKPHRPLQHHAQRPAWLAD